MASVMWNHALAMWSAMEAKEVARPAIGDKQKICSRTSIPFATRPWSTPSESKG